MTDEILARISRADSLESVRASLQELKDHCVQELEFLDGLENESLVDEIDVKTRNGVWYLRRKVISEVMRSVAPRWLVLMSIDEKRSLFDFFFSQGSLLDTFLGIHTVLVDIYSKKCAASDDREESGERVLSEEIFATLIKLLSTEASICTCLHSAHKRGSAYVLDLIKGFVALPDLIMGVISANARRSMRSNTFSPNVWFDLLAGSIFRAVPPEIPSSACVELATKLTRVGRGEIIAYAWMRHCGTQESVDRLHFMRGMDDFIRQKLIICFLHTVDRDPNYCRDISLIKAMISALLGDVSELESGGALFGCRCKLLMSLQFSPVMTWALVDIFKSYGAKFFFDCVSQVAALWSKRSFIHGIDYSQQEYVSGILYDMLGFLASEDLEKRGIMLLIMNGVHFYLESGIGEIRNLGMFVAQKLSQRLEQDSPLVFEEISDRVFRYSRDANLHDSITAAGDAEIGDPVSANDKTCEPEDTAQGNKESDPDEIVQFVGFDPSAEEDLDAIENANIWQETYESDSTFFDEDLESLSPIGDLKDLSVVVAMPSYLRDCIPMLQNDKDYKQVETVLMGLEKLVQSIPADSVSNSKEIAAVLLHLENRFNLDCFAICRMNSLVALTASPDVYKPIVELLASAVFAKSEFVSIRLDALEVIAQAAKRCSKAGNEIGSANNDVDIKQEKDSVKRSGKVLREWGKRKHPLRKPKPNRFHPVAAEFFYCLAMPINLHEELLLREPMVFSKLLNTLGVVLYCSANSPHCERMAKAGIDIVWWARYASTEATVTMSCVSMLAQILGAVPSKILASDPFWLNSRRETQSWLTEVVNRDPDQTCRFQAKLLLSSFS